MSKTKKTISCRFYKSLRSVAARYFLMLSILLLLLLSLLSLCRWFMIVSTVDTRLPDIPDSNIGFIAMTLLQGLWRDNVLAALMVSFPTLAGIGAIILSIRRNCLVWKSIFIIASIYYAVIIPACVLTSIANLPYYAEFCKPIDVNTLHSLEGNSGSIIVDMIFSEKEYIYYMLLSLLLWLLILAIIIIITKVSYSGRKNKPHLSDMRWGVLLIIYIVMSIVFRPVKINQANYSSDGAYDRMALSPTLYLGISLLHQKDVAFATAPNYVHFLTEEQTDSLSHVFEIGGNIKQSEEYGFFERTTTQEVMLLGNSRPNIVLILMEGMSARLMGSFGQGDSLTPFLDSIYQNSLHFSHCYSVGMRTSNGIFGTLTSWPSVMCYHPITAYKSYSFNGLPVQLKKMGYKNMFFIPHQAEFDGLDSFLPRQRFEDIYSKQDYDSERFVNIWGPNDEYVFEYALPVLRRAASDTVPFFATILTISNHAPYTLPVNFKPHNSDIKFQMVEYADYALSKFFEAAYKESWYDNTLFVLVADHGRIQQETECELSDQLNHVPLMILGAGVEPKECDSPTSQMDIMHIVLGLLGKDDNRSMDFGINVLASPRKYVTYCSWTMIACRSLDRLYIYNDEDCRESFYLLKGNDCTIAPYDEEFRRMKEYMQFIYQLSDNILQPYKQNVEWVGGKP